MRQRQGKEQRWLFGLRGYRQHLAASASKFKLYRQILVRSYMPTTKALRSLTQTSRLLYQSRLGIVRRSHPRVPTRSLMTESTNLNHKSPEKELDGAKSPTPLTEREQLLHDIHENGAFYLDLVSIKFQCQHRRRK